MRKSIVQKIFASALAATPVFASLYQSPAQSQQMDTVNRIKANDAGLRIDPFSTGFKISGLLKGGVAQSYGLQVWNFILKINGRDTLSMKPAEIAEAFSADNNKKVNLVVSFASPQSPDSKYYYQVVTLPLKKSAAAEDNASYEMQYNPMRTDRQATYGDKQIYLEEIAGVIERRNGNLIGMSGIQTGSNVQFLKTGDVITRIDGRDLSKYSYEENVAWLKYSPSDNTQVTALRKGDMIIEGIITRNMLGSDINKRNSLERPAVSQSLLNDIEKHKSASMVPRPLTTPVLPTEPASPTDKKNNYYDKDTVVTGFYSPSRAIRLYADGRYKGILTINSCVEVKAWNKEDALVKVKMNGETFDSVVSKKFLTPIFDAKITPETCRAETRISDPDYTASSIGMTVRAYKNSALVDQVYKGGPADNAGVCIGDIIVSYGAMSPGLRHQAKVVNGPGFTNSNAASSNDDFNNGVWNLSTLWVRMIRRPNDKRSEYFYINTSKLPKDWHKDSFNLKDKCQGLREYPPLSFYDLPDKSDIDRFNSTPPKAPSVVKPPELPTGRIPKEGDPPNGNSPFLKGRFESTAISNVWQSPSSSDKPVREKLDVGSCVSVYAYGGTDNLARLNGVTPDGKNIEAYVERKNLREAAPEKHGINSCVVILK